MTPGESSSDAKRPAGLAAAGTTPDGDAGVAAGSSADHARRAATAASNTEAFTTRPTRHADLFIGFKLTTAAYTGHNTAKGRARRN